MSDDKPTPPAGLPKDVVELFEGFSAESLHQVAHYAEDLAAFKSQAVEGEEAAEEDGQEQAEPEQPDQDDDIPDDVPSKASLTVKEINGNRYYYWQWREGDDIKSKYKGPVNLSN